MEENKKYSIVGQVTIGTDEYRDLIEAVKESQAEADRQRSQWCDQYHKANKLEEENKKLKEKLKKYEEFINQDTVRDKFALFLVQFKNLEE